MRSDLPAHDIVLWGVGHTNAHVLRMWMMRPIPDARLTCVSDTPIATYSGMLPAVLAGELPRERMEIDLVRLCASSGARLVVGEVTGLDRDRRELRVADRPPIPYDALSIGIGSVPSGMGPEAAERDGSIVPIKPMWSFLDRLSTRLRAIEGGSGVRPIRMVVVGGGVGGAEIAMCLPPFVRACLGPVPLTLTIVDAGSQLAAAAGVRAGRLIREVLVRRGVRIELGSRVARVADGVVTLEGGESTEIEADVVLWATGAAAPSILASTGLSLDGRGFLLTRPTLQTLDDDVIFAVGDSGTLRANPTAKAGVFAVRQGPFLFRNLARQLAGERPEQFVPQRRFLKLINVGDGTAVGEYRGVAVRGRTARWLKGAIDGRFMDRYQDYRPMVERGVSAAADVPRTPNPSPPRCLGCGGKVGAGVLSKALGRLEIPADERVLVGLGTPDDAAIVRAAGSGQIAITADFFAAPLDDPYLCGRLGALHATSDAFAMGATPRFAVALLTLPLGPARQQEQILFEVLSGALHEFRAMGVSLVGGHTIEGPTLTIGFTVLADPAASPHAKANFRAGDRLVLTKPLGTGVLLAGHMRALCRATWFESLVRTMLGDNRLAARLFGQHEIHGATDVTGFGLAGHLIEILQASGLDATLALDALPLLPGFAELVDLGVESTLAPANREVERWITASESVRRSAAYAALFDPQTCGGLLLGVPESEVVAIIRTLASRGVAAAPIGCLHPAECSVPGIRLVGGALD